MTAKLWKLAVMLLGYGSVIFAMVMYSMMLSAKRMADDERALRLTQCGSAVPVVGSEKILEVSR